MVTFQTECYLEAVRDADELTRRHWEEIARNRNQVPLKIDHVGYQKMEDRGQLLVITAREAGRLIGYLTYFIMPQGNLHYLGTPWAESDIFYVEPESRNSRIGTGLFGKAESELRARGVRVMHTRSKNEHPAAAKLLSGIGHVPIETVHAKVLD